MVDMRKRFRGNKPISTSTELEAGGGKEVGMLYAGKSGYEGVGPKGSDGKDDEQYEKWVRNDGVEDIRKK
jgi:cytochrome c oxidase assembly factor 5